ncbi:MAG: hypothetical protein A2Y57_03495 [Candidatus Woykebacteria bacterium RBG_13_40_7b]|uniref:HAD family hydrolase n=1 Tax=Candidatus Woykebacteria bacterium RBG_13_40_7b TaxID=1802594 RepID=A0A1G1WAS7_9BACT|nr:MAG: hypothetical protein A2Y57_03495 [Candidatus Woykebacteria bacterium RBG_13_40_7b]
MIKALIFDCWDTLFGSKIEPHPFSPFAEKVGRSMQDYEFIKVFEKYFMLEKHLDLEVPIKKLLNELSIDYSENSVTKLKSMLEKAFNSLKVFPETLPVLEDLKKNYKLGLITNTFYQSFRKLEQNFRVSEIFDVILKSYETKILKPDPKIFEIMIRKLNVNKEGALMIGDSLQDDVQAAENFGIKGILVDRKGKYPNHINRIESLEQLKEFI